MNRRSSMLTSAAFAALLLTAAACSSPSESEDAGVFGGADAGSQPRADAAAPVVGQDASEPAQADAGEEPDAATEQADAAAPTPTPGTVVVSTEDTIMDFAVDSTHVYWLVGHYDSTSPGTRQIWRKPLAGGDAAKLVDVPLQAYDREQGIACFIVGGGTLYWGEKFGSYGMTGLKLSSQAADGSGSPQVVYESAERLGCPLRTDGTDLFFGGHNRVDAYNIHGAVFRVPASGGATARTLVGEGNDSMLPKFELVGDQVALLTPGLHLRIVAKTGGTPRNFDLGGLTTDLAANATLVFVSQGGGAFPAKMFATPVVNPATAEIFSTTSYAFASLVADADHVYYVRGTGSAAPYGLAIERLPVAGTTPQMITEPMDTSDGRSLSMLRLSGANLYFLVVSGWDPLVSEIRTLPLP